MRTGFFICFFLMIFFSCGSREEKIPKSIIQPDRMSLVLAEIHTIDAATNMHKFQNIIMPADPKPVYELAFKKYGVSKAEFDSSYKYYTQHPDKLNDIYAEVLNELSRRQAQESVVKK